MLDTNSKFSPLPNGLDFEVRFEPSLVESKKYVINDATGEYLDVVGSGFNCVSHPEFYANVQDCIVENISEDDLLDADVKYNSARNGAWSMMDLRLPNSKFSVTTDKHQTDVHQRIIALHGVDGSCSNVCIFGAIDFFCTNGIIKGDYDKVKRKNTSGFNIDMFIQQLRRSKQDFHETGRQLQRYADTPLAHKYHNVVQLFKDTMPKKKAERMVELYHQEIGTRGQNVWSLYSALTNYASYADERNGFALRETGGDRQAITMFNREVEVAELIKTPAFLALAA
jgi:hypothetical protein